MKTHTTKTKRLNRGPLNRYVGACADCAWESDERTDPDSVRELRTAHERLTDPARASMFDQITAALRPVPEVTL